ncbi:MAG: YlxR family protein [Chloroflexi bacterium]|nr:YlxR family protein [Chloroflexota bacterium]
MSIRQPVNKHVPQRTCVACRQVRAKRELIRLVCGGDGSVEIDTGSKKPGRGAYLCHTPGCWELGLKTGQLERTLRTSLSKDNRERLQNYGRDSTRSSQ